MWRKARICAGFNIKPVRTAFFCCGWKASLAPREHTAPYRLSFARYHDKTKTSTSTTNIYHDVRLEPKAIQRRRAPSPEAVGIKAR